MSSYYPQIVSLFYSILVMASFFLKKKFKTIENNIFTLLLIGNFVGLILDLIGFYFVLYTNNTLLSIIFAKLILIYLVLWIFTMTVYIYAVSKKVSYGNKTENDDKWKKYELFKKIIIFMEIITCLICIILPMEIVKNGDLISTKSNANNLLYILSSILIIYWIIIMIKNNKNIKEKKFYPIYAYMVLGGIVAAIQYFNPTLILITPLETFITILMFFTIENPDVKTIEQLNMARDLAEKANNAKTDFLSSMSHEIRTPLNAIVGFSQCIQDAENIDIAKENAKDIITASNTLLDIVNGILDISKIESGKLELVNTRYESKNLFENVAKLVKPRMDEKGLELKIEIAEDIPAVLYGDYANFKKVLTNLLSNASKYTDKGYVKYCVSCINQNNICRLLITVEDTGRGIKPESINKLFSRFERVDEDKNSTIEGTGLGLAITKKIIEMMNGKIVVQSIYGSGSKFTVMVDQVIDEDQSVSEENSNTKEEVKIENKKFLIVDDNKLNLKVASKIINSMYPSVIIETVESGFECLDKIKQGNKYDLILMDDMMPKMNGVETFHRLRENKTFDVPVIALTANAINGMREKYLAEGFNDYLSKPIDRTDFNTVLLRLFGHETDSKIMEEITGQMPVINEETQDKTTILRKNGIDVNHAIELLGDMEMYNDTLDSFLSEIQNKINDINKYRRKSDMINYSIQVHSLKSDSKYLGFMKLAEIAYEHELKSKEKDIQYINDHFQELVNELRRVIDVVTKYKEKE